MTNNIYNKVKKGAGVVTLSSLLLSLSFTSCSEWTDHYDNLAGAESCENSLWQTMIQNPQLSDFCEVLENTKVFRMHKKTSVSYKDLLSSGQSFTVMAPVNGTFDKQALLELVADAKGDSAVEKSFVLNHLSRYVVPVADESKSVRLANMKRITMGNGKVGDVDILQSNISAHNGVLHVVGSQVQCESSIYEALINLPQFTSVGAVLRQYEDDYFDESASLPSGMVDGLTIYADSVVRERNSFLESKSLMTGGWIHDCLINSEDSTFYAVVPSNDGWDKAWEEALPYFQYDSKVVDGEAMQKLWTAHALLDNAAFSHTIQAAPQDSLIGYNYDRIRGEYQKFYKPFAPGGIMGNPTRVIPCSNGTLYETAEWPFKPEETYFKIIRMEGENISNQIEISKTTINKQQVPSCTTVTRVHYADSISDNRFLDIIPASGTVNWAIEFNIENTLAGAYDIDVVTIPQTVINDEIDPSKLKPVKFKATIKYPKLDGTIVEDKLTSAGYTGNDPSRVDTISIAKGFKFPACNFDQKKNEKVTITLTCNITAKETSKYERNMLLDCIILRPARKE